MEQQKRNTTLFVGLLVVGIYFLGAIVFSIFDLDKNSLIIGILILPGSWFFSGLSYAGLFVPVMFIFAAILEFQQKLTVKRVLVLAFALIPVIFLGALIQVLTDPDSKAPFISAIQSLLGPVGSTIFLGTLSLLGFVLWGQVYYSTAKKELRNWYSEEEASEIDSEDQVTEGSQNSGESTLEEFRKKPRVNYDKPVIPKPEDLDYDYGFESVAKQVQDEVEPDEVAPLESSVDSKHSEDLNQNSEALSSETLISEELPIYEDDFEEAQDVELLKEEDFTEAAEEEEIEEESFTFSGGSITQDVFEEDSVLENHENKLDETREQDSLDSSSDAIYVADETPLDDEDFENDVLDQEDENDTEEFDPDQEKKTNKTLSDISSGIESSVPQIENYTIPVAGLLDEHTSGDYWVIDNDTKAEGEVLRTTLEEFGIEAQVTGIRKGPVITMFEILPAPGVKLARIVNLADNIALRLAAASVRIVAPIPGKHAVGIEIPNKRRHLVSFSELLQESSFHNSDKEIPVALGKDITGDAQIVDLTKTPHLLIAGATGSGKSVCVNSLICSILYRRSPEEVRMVLIDPKIVELKFYNDIPHLLTPVITDSKKAFQALQWCIFEMERRYTLLDALAVRDIKSYNAKIKKQKMATTSLPYIVVVVDEFADLMATTGKELESTLARLAAMSRAVGIHLVLATQRPSTDVITGLIKANIPSRIAFMVASKVDSRIIIDSMGAEKLLGKGDMLFTSAWNPFPFRMQGAFLSEEEVERIVNHVKALGNPKYIDDEIFIEDDEEGIYQPELEDPLMEKAIEIVTTAGKASASYLQRRLKIGYNRAARLVEQMESIGIVGPQNGSKPREVLKTVGVL